MKRHNFSLAQWNERYHCSILVFCRSIAETLTLLLIALSVLWSSNVPASPKSTCAPSLVIVHEYSSFTCHAVVINHDAEFLCLTHSVWPLPLCVPIASLWPQCLSHCCFGVSSNQPDSLESLTWIQQVLSLKLEKWVLMSQVEVFLCIWTWIWVYFYSS